MNTESLRMRKDNVLVEMEPVPEYTRSRLIALPATADRKAIQGVPARVLAAGPGYDWERKIHDRPERRGEYNGPRVVTGFVATTVKPGDRVLVEHMAGDRAQNRDGRDLRIVRESEIMAIIDGETEVL